MDPVRNPYSPGAGNAPPALVGRDDELERFSVAIQRLEIGRHARSMMLTGLRGVGKTVLLREFGKIAESRRWVHLPLEASENMAFPLTMAMLVRKALLRLSIAERFSERARRAFGVLRSFQIRWQLPEGSDISFEFDPVAGYADSGILDEDLAGLFSEAGGLAASDGIGVLFTIDEIQYLGEADLNALIMALHRVNQFDLPVIVAGAGLPSLAGLAGEAKSYAERLFEFVTIANLDPAEASAALATPATREGVTWDKGALRTVIELTQGYPYFLQEFGKQAWDIADGPDRIHLRDVELATILATDELDTGFFRVRIDRVTETERSYLVAMASLGGPGPYRSGDVAEAMGRTTGQVGPYRDRLIKQGVIYAPSHGHVSFTVPMFDDYLRRAFGIEVRSTS